MKKTTKNIIFGVALAGILVSCVGLLKALADGTVRHEKEVVKESACQELLDTFCLKTSTCFGMSNQDCLVMFKEPFDNTCKNKEAVAINKCSTDFKDVKCDGVLPDSCSFLE